MSTAAVALRGVVKTYAGGRVRANDGIEFDIGQGEVFGLLGPNGAGKSTLVRQVSGVIHPDAGAISVLGHDVVARPHEAAQLVAYVAQEEPALLDLGVRAAVMTTGRLRGLSRSRAAGDADDLLDELGLVAVADRPLATLSGGQRRLACVASALAARRPVLILDEPTAGLDPVARRGVWSALRRRRDDDGATVLLVTHNVIEAESVLDRVAILDRGRAIACDTPGRLKAKVSDEVSLELVWRLDPPLADPAVAALADRAAVVGRRWTLRLHHDEARVVLGRLTSGAVFAALDDFTLATPSLEDVYVALGGRADDMERS